MRAWLAIIGVAASASWAAPNAVVEAVVAPAWLERGGSSQPLEPGVTLTAGDGVRTGSAARAYLRFADGSRTKLGESAQLTLDRVASRSGVLEAALQVARGAFRYTTGILQPGMRGRDVTVRVATLTAGIRGTDLWGKSERDRDLVCLLEGRIEVAHESGQRVAMDQPNSFVVAPRGQPPLPVAAVDPAQVAIWARETEIEPGRGAASEAGSWRVLAARGVAEPAAFAAYTRLREAGFAARLQPRAGLTYDVSIARLADRREAEALAARLRAELDLPGARAAR